MLTTLLGTKLHIPPLGRAFVPRQRLISQLESGLGAKLTLVLAPARLREDHSYRLLDSKLAGGSITRSAAGCLAVAGRRRR